MEDPALATSAPGLGVIGRYAIHGKLAAGSMATVHFGRLLGPAGFSRPVAIKRLNPHLAKDPEFVAMFLDEARVAARIQHPNVVVTLDVVAKGDELFLVMDYVRGESLARLLRASRVQGIEITLSVIASIMAATLHGLHAVHEARNEHGESLGVVHRAVSPQNVLVGVDGVPRIIDFGVAKAAARAPMAQGAHRKGRLSYMAPEQLQNRGVDRRTDVFAAGVVLWEAITGRRLFDADEPDEVFRMIVSDGIPPPSAVVPSVSRELDSIVLSALSRDPHERFATAREFAIALEHATPLASSREVGEWVERVAGDVLLHRETQVAELESGSAPAQPSIFKDDSRPNFMKTLDDRTPLPGPKPGASEWDEAPTGVFDPTKSHAAALLASRARALAASPKSGSKPPLPTSRSGSKGAPPAPSGSHPPLPNAGRGQRTLMGGVAVLPVARVGTSKEDVQIFDDEDEMTIVRDQPTVPSEPPPLPTAAFDDELETTTIYDSPDDVGSTAPRTQKVVSVPAQPTVIQVPVAARQEDALDGRITLPPRIQIPAVAKATVGPDGVATIIVQERTPSVPPPVQSVQIAQIKKQRDFWNSPIAFVGLIGVLVALAASLGLVLGRARSRNAVAETAPVPAQPASPVAAAAPPPVVAAPPPPPATAAPQPPPAPAPAEPATATAVAAVEPPPAAPDATDSPSKKSKKSSHHTKTASASLASQPVAKTQASPEPKPAAAPPPAAPAKPMFEDSLDINPYASK